MQAISPEHWVVYFPIHNHCFKHGSFSDDKLDHSVNQQQEIPAEKIHLTVPSVT